MLFEIKRPSPVPCSDFEEEIQRQTNETITDQRNEIVKQFNEDRDNRKINLLWK